MSAKKELKEAPAKYEIPNFKELVSEYNTRKMPDRKIVALKNKLIELHNEDKNTPEAHDLMVRILKDERRRARISSADLHFLNKLEYDLLDQEAIVKTEHAPAVHHLKKDLVVRFSYDPDYNDGRLKPDSIGRFNVYVPIVIPPDHQLPMSVARKEAKGHPVDPSEYPKEKTIIHHIMIKEKEFNAWFEAKEDQFAVKPEKEFKYNF